MAEPNEFVEEMEHAAHGAHAEHEEGSHSGKLGKHVGITMALLGVLLALCSALVNAERTELIATMVEQTNTSMKLQTISTKYRMLVAQLLQLQALTPDLPQFKEWEKESRKLVGEVSNPDLSRAVRIIRLENAKTLSAELPDYSDMLRFTNSIKMLRSERDAAQAWTDSFDAAIKTHFLAAEHYEWAQLSCEIAIVVASISLLFLNRLAWYAAIILGLSGLSIVGVTFFMTNASFSVAEEKLTHARGYFESFNSEKKDRDEDDKLIQEVEQYKSPDLGAR
jgi:hypothetical protein